MFTHSASIRDFECSRDESGYGAFIARITQRESARLFFKSGD
jgi:hypothetical protein